LGSTIANPATEELVRLATFYDPSGSTFMLAQEPQTNA
jgi:hypothetical protein